MVVGPLLCWVLLGVAGADDVLDVNDISFALSAGMLSRLAGPFVEADADDR